MRKLISRILTVIFVINIVFSGIGNITFVNAASDTFNFNWDKSRKMNDLLELLPRSTSQDDVFLWWDFGINESMNVDTGTYTLNYNIEDNKRIDFTVEKKNNVAIVTYKVWSYEDNAYILPEDTGYEVYKASTGSYVEPIRRNLPPLSDDVGVIYDTFGNRVEKEGANFSIVKDTGFSFKYDNKTIHFKWAGGSTDLFYFSTSGVAQGNIYDIDLSLAIKGRKTVEQSIKLFTGINQNSFKCTPYANERKNVIDHSTRPFKDIDDPGTDPELDLEFDMPKVWDSTQHKYVFPDETYTKSNPTTLIIDLGHTDDKKKIQILIDNIYADDINSGLTFSTYSDAQVNAAVTDGSRITVTVSKLVAGTIYNPVQISLSKTDDDEFLSVASEIKHGLVYTYPVFSVISMAADEFYLKIEPYKGYKGYYTVYSGATTQTMSKWAEYEDKTGGTTDVFLPVNLNAINNLTQFFKVNFEFTPPGQAPGVATATLDSQILKYTPDETDIVISTPTDLEITKQLIVENAAKNGEELMLSLKWNISYLEILKNLVSRNGGSLSVEYLFNCGEVPYDTDEKLFSKITLDMKLNGDDLEITMKDDDNRLEEYSWSTKEVLESGTVYEMAVGHITLRLPISAVGVSTDPLFEYPGIYFLNTRAQYYLGTTHYKTSASIPIDMTLDSQVSIELARPQNLKTVEGETDYDSFAAVWDTLDYEKETAKLYSYRVEMLETRGYTIGEDSVLYNLYITSDKDLMDKFVAAEDERDELPENLKDKISTYDNDSKKASSFDFTEIGKISDLRNGNIVKIENIMQDNSASKQNLEFLGLDENMEYYVVMETVLIPVNMETEDYEEKEKQISKFSTIISATTQLNPENPKESEKNPAVPTNFDKEKVTLNSASLKWDKVKEVADPLSDSTLEYQFIRITGQKMDANLIDSRLDYNETWSKLPTAVGKAGWRTNSGKVYEYMPYESNFAKTVADSKNFTYDNSGYTTYYLKDMTLIPNELYFYYIRTVRISGGEDEAYSVWVPLSVTTTPVDSPTNLKVLPEYKRDAKTEIAIGFTLPELPLEKLGHEYLIQYSTKQDTDEWTEDKTMAMSDVTVTKNDDGTLYCEYLIDGLKEGTMYSIRVRLYNTVLKDASLYSNTAQARTDLDQDDYDKKKKKNDWIEHYIDLLEELVTNPYWVIKDTTGTVNVVYRPNSFSSVIASSPSGVIDLYKGELDAEKKIYYLPSKAIKQAYDADKGFRISYKDSEVVFSARSIDPGLNDAIIDINKNISEHSVDDYFVKLTVTYNNVSYDIDGNAAVGPVVNIEAEAVGSKKNIEVWDKDMVALLMEKIIDEEDLDELAKDIEEDVNDEESNKKLVKLIKKYVDEFKDDFEDDVDKEINKVVRKNYVSTKLNKNIIIANAIDADVSVSGNRQQNGTWTNVEVSGYGAKKAIYTLEPGTYAFSGKKIAIPGITNVPNGGAITQMVVKYSLDDYFGKDTAFNLNAKLTKNMAVGAAARIAGAKKGDNPITFFNSKGINVSTRGNTNATTQEAIYLAMASYQIRTGVKVDNIRVTNYKNTADATGLQPAYKKSVQAAYSMGAYNNNNLQPNEPMTVKDFLQILVNLKM